MRYFRWIIYNRSGTMRFWISIDQTFFNHQQSFLTFCVIILSHMGKQIIKAKNYYRNTGMTNQFIWMHVWTIYSMYQLKAVHTPIIYILENNFSSKHQVALHTCRNIWLTKSLNLKVLDLKLLMDLMNVHKNSKTIVSQAQI